MAAPTQTIALGVEYDGAAYHGWQRQRTVTSVQQVLEQALSRIAAEPLTVAAAGRTDTGVHATQQVVSFTTHAERPDKAWRLGVNSHLDNTASVVWVRQVPNDFHARFTAVARRYCYIYGPADQRALSGGLLWSGAELDAPAMHAAAQALLGEQDFSAVRAAGCGAATPIRSVHRVSVRRHGRLVVLDIEANAFLLHMVRNIASALQQIGAGRRSTDWLRELLASGDRTQLGPTAPPQGLYLIGVRYPPEIGLPGPRLPPLLLPLGEADALC